MSDFALILQSRLLRIMTCIGVTVSLFLIPVGSFADDAAPLNAFMDNIGGQPVTITGCSVSQSPASGSPDVRLKTMMASVTFTNTRQAAVTGINTEIIVYDAFNMLIGTRTGQDTTGIGANETKTSTWDDLQGFGTTAVANAHCSVAKVIFSDGSVWTRP